ncbi:hypothetical protein Fmac_017666 [Flemingia macrophylla]|uniref:Uncharacterized protein n=1 Tax=Flemingia macrophylla TaxID=520843 RepID=A0ABD1M2T6_9FABA
MSHIDEALFFITEKLRMLQVQSDDQLAHLHHHVSHKMRRSTMRERGRSDAIVTLRSARGLTVSNLQELLYWGPEIISGNVCMGDLVGSLPESMQVKTTNAKKS